MTRAYIVYEKKNNIFSVSDFLDNIGSLVRLVADDGVIYRDII